MIIILIGASFFVCLKLSTKKASAATHNCYWVGDVADSVWNDATHWADVSKVAGTCAGIGNIPSADTTVIFDGTNDNTSSVNAVFSVTAITISADYSGTITLGANLTSADNVSLAGGTISLGNNAYKLTAASVTISGGALTVAAQTSKTIKMTISGAFTQSAGTTTIGRLATMSVGSFSLSSTGAFNLYGHYTTTNTALTVSGNFTVTGGTFSDILSSTYATRVAVGGNVSISGGTVSIENWGTLDVEGTFTLSESGIFTMNATSGNIYVGGNCDMSGGTATVTTSIHFDGNTATFTPTSSNYYDLEIVKTAGQTLNMGGNLSITREFLISSGSLNAGSYTVTLNGTGKQKITSAGQSFNNLTIKNTYASGGTNGCYPADTLNIAGNMTVQADGASAVNIENPSNVAVNITGNLSTAGAGAGAKKINMGTNTWAVGGNVDFTGGTITASTSILLLNSSLVAQSITAGSSSLYNLIVTNTHTGGVTFANSLTLTGTFTDTTASSKLTFHSLSTYDFAAISLNGQASGTKIIMVSSDPANPTPASRQWYFNISGASPQATFVNVTDSDATGGNAITPTNCTDGGNNENWSFSIVVSGTIYTAENKSTNIGADKTIALSINGVAATTVETTSGGVFSFSNVTVVANNTLGLFISAETEKGSLVTQAVDSSTNVTGLELFTSHIILSHQTAGPMTSTLLATADNVVDPDLLISIDGSNIATFTTENEVWIISTKSYTPGAGVAAGGINITGTFSPEGNTITLTNSVTPLVVSGTFNESTSTIIYTGASATNITGTTYNNLILNHADTTFTSAGSTTVKAVLTITAGIFDASNQTIILSGSSTPLVINGTFTPSTSTISYTGGSATNITATDYYILEAKPASGSPTYTLALGTFNVSNNCTIGDGSNAVTVTVDTNDPTLNIDGALAIAVSATSTASNSGTFSVAGNFTNSGTFTDSDGTLTLDGSALQIVTAAGTDASHDFKNLIITNASAAGISFADSATVTGTFTNITGSSKLTFHAGSTYTFANININGASEQFVTLRSSSNDSPWFLNVAEANPAVTYVDVRDSNASGGSSISAFGGTNINSGANINWSFPATSSTTLTDNVGTHQTTYDFGAEIFVNAADADKNTDPASKQSVNAVVTSPTSASDSETITLTETGNNTGIFRNLIGLAFTVYQGVKTNNDAILHVDKDATTITATYTDAVDPGDTSSDAATATVVGPISSIIVTPSSTTVVAGGNVSFSAKSYDINNTERSGDTFTWSVVGGGGTISFGGVFTAGNIAGTYSNTVKTESGSVSGMASVIVTNVTTSAPEESNTVATDTSSMDVKAPSPIISKPAVAEINKEIILSGENSTDDTAIIKYQWDFGDGATASGMIVKHTYSKLDRFKITLTVYDAAGNNASADSYIDIYPNTPSISNITTDGKTSITITGAAMPLVTVVVEIHSEPYISETISNKNGYWQMQIDYQKAGLSLGKHNILVYSKSQLANASSDVESGREDYNLTLTSDDGKLNAVIDELEVTKRKQLIINYSVIVAIMIIIGFLGFVWYKRRKNFQNFNLPGSSALT